MIGSIIIFTKTLSESFPNTNLLTFWGHLLDPRPDAPGEWDINLGKIATMAQYLDVACEDAHVGAAVDDAVQDVGGVGDVAFAVVCGATTKAAEETAQAAKILKEAETAFAATTLKETEANLRPLCLELGKSLFRFVVCYLFMQYQ